MAGEVTWEDESDVREIIADVRDAECEMTWVLFGYGPLGIKKLTVLEAGDGGIAEMTQHLSPDAVMFCFMQVAEKAFAFFQWVPEKAGVMYTAKATVHRSFITSYLGALAFDIVAHTLDDITEEKINEELNYRDATAGRSLNAADAAKKLEEESQRKVEMAKKQALAGNTHEAQKRLAQHATWTKGGADAPTMMKAGGVNVAKAAQVKTMSHSLYSASKIAVEFEDEDGLKELCLELRELEEAGDFDWMMLGYAEDKKNALRLLETGNGGREAIVDYVREDMAGAQDKVMYLILKEDYSCSKCTFIYWIGSKVPAFVKANTSTHRGAISEWITQVIHNLKEECVSTGNELLGLKDHEEDAENESVVGEGSDAVNESTANVIQIDSQLHAKPYAGKVLEEVVRDKTPHELWLERKMAKDSGVAPASSDRKSSVGGATPVGGAHQFTQVVLKKNDPSGKPKGAGRSKWSQKKDLASDGGSSEHGSETSESALSSAKTGVGSLAEQARAAADEAERLEKEAARRRVMARELEERAKREQLQDVMGEEPDWSPDDLSEADGDGEEDYKELGGDATVTNEVERTRSAAAEEEAKAEAEAAREAEKRAQEEAAAKKKEEEAKQKEEEEARRKEEETRRKEEEEVRRKKEAEAAAAAAAARQKEEEAQRRQAEEEEERRSRARKEQEVRTSPFRALPPPTLEDMEATLRKEEERRREMEAEEYAAEQLRLKEQVTNA
eukprot:Tamp_02950.p1 GENE.Tamp_02950~~Tamp_02950.p1  ORF type:complete len:730 (+),score=275.52 Tamp_02950:374-2563(+)